MIHRILLTFLSLWIASCQPRLAVVINESAASKIGLVDTLLPLIAKEGETVSFQGSGMRRNLKMTIDDLPYPIAVDTQYGGSFKLEGVSPGLKKINFILNGTMIGSFSMIADTAGDGLPIFPMTPDLICLGISYRDGSGALQEGTRSCGDQTAEFCTVDGAKGCVTSESLPAISRAALLPELAKIHETISVAGIYGTMKDCSDTDQIGCLINPNLSLRALIGTDIDTTKILASYEALGVEGTLGDCTISGSANCYATGTFFAAEACTALASNCYVPNYNAMTQPLKAANVDGITPAVIRDGVTLAGVTGEFPSASYPLAVADLATDITTLNFEATIATAGTFAWFDRFGNRYTQAGDSHLAAAQLRAGVDVFGTIGTQEIPGEWDVRLEVDTDSASSGKVKTLCNNRSNLTLWDIFPPVVPASGITMDIAAESLTIPGHGLASGDSVYIDFYSGSAAPTPLDASTLYYVIRLNDDEFQLAASFLDATNVIPVPIDLTQAGSQVIAYKVGSTIANALNTVNDWNGGSAMSTLTNWMADAKQVCEGLESLPGDDNAWKESATATCTAAPADCIMQDKISGLEWSKVVSIGHWMEAIISCEELVHDTEDDWRLPTLKELNLAYLHGMRSAASANWITNNDFNQQYWSSTTYSAQIADSWNINLATGEVRWDPKVTDRFILCVRNP